MKFKKLFLERYEKLTDIENLTSFLLKPLRKSIRVNTLKTSIERIKEVFTVEQIPWCKEGFFVNEYGIGNTKEHFLGYIYVQEAASMIPPIVLNPNSDDIILDMCASPGSKTTQLAALMRNNGLIIANDVSIDRLKPLTINLQRCGVLNTIITKMDGKSITGSFDKVLVDAPCSGVGVIRKSYKTILMWNPNMIKKLANLQKGLIERGFKLLKDNGVMVYSTCTLEPEENEGVIDFLLNKYENAKIERINLDIKHSSPIMEFENKRYNGQIKDCLRIWPQDNDTEGFFVAKIRKI